MGVIRLLAAPIRHILRSRLFQLAVVVTIILILDYYSFDYAPLRQIADALKALVTATVQLCSEYFRVGILTDPVLQVGLLILYVYLVCLLLFVVARFIVGIVIDFIGLNNILWLRNTIAHERGVAAYRAWEPLERIRPANVPQEKWEEAFAWPANDRPPYPPLIQRVLRGALSYVVVIVAVAVLLQLFTPFPVLSWVSKLR
jgi:hypothetical protein